MSSKTNLLSLHDLTSEEIDAILQDAAKMKAKPKSAAKVLEGKNVALVFQKPSNRTRVSFEVGINQLGGNCIYLGPHEINLGVRESTEDVAKTLTRYLDGIVARTNSHDDIVRLAQNATVPIINGLSDLYHPCQALADLLSIREKLGKFEGRTLTYIGDGNNVAHSLIIGCAKMGMNIAVATPQGYEPESEVIAEAMPYAAKTNAKISVSHSPKEAARGAHVLYSDVWVSMGQEDQSKQRLNDFKDFQVNDDLVGCAHADYIFMHCLPAHRGVEVSAKVIDGEHSIVFDQAENRLHVQKAILKFLYS